MNDSTVTFDRIQMNVQDAVIMLNPTGLITYWNLGAQNIFGWSEKEALGKDLHQLIVPTQYLPKFKEGFKHFKLTGQGPAINKTLSLSARHKDGHEFPVDLTLGAISIENNWYSVGVVRDKAIQQQLEFQLMHAEKLESISTLAAGFAHDFNNILASIIGYAELAMDDAKMDSILFSNLTEVLTASSRAKDLIRQILKSSSQMDDDKKPVHLKSLVQEALKLVRASFPDDIDITMDLSSDKYINANPSRIHQMILNLCTNAGHAMKNKGLLKVSLKDVQDISSHAPKKIEEKNDYICLSVEDTGIGMTSDILSQAFSPFFTTRKQGEGRGMGLSLVHGTVSNLSGWVEPNSKPGKGSRFDIYLPAHNKTLSQRRPLPSAPIHKEGKILFVDDEDPIVKMGQQLLERMGYKVEGLTSSSKALERFKSSPDLYYLVITDLVMPAMNGLDLSKQLLLIRPNLPIIICTGYGLSISEIKAQEAGIKAVVHKPILSDEMAETIGQVLTS